MIEQFQRYNETHNNGFLFKPMGGNGTVNAILTKEGTHRNSNYLIETDELGDLSAPLEVKSLAQYLGFIFLGNENE